MPLNASTLWNGSMLAFLAHTIFTCRAPELAYEQSWDSENYSIQDSQGTKGTIVFSNNRYVAVFLDIHSSQAPWHSDVSYDIQRFFYGLPEALNPFAEEALQYVLEDYQGNTIPVITAAFWSDGENEDIGAAAPWDEIIKHGAFLIETQMMVQEDAITILKANYELSSDEMEFMNALYERLICRPKANVRLDEKERSFLRSIAVSKKGLVECKKLLAQIGIII